MKSEYVPILSTNVSTHITEKYELRRLILLALFLSCAILNSSWSLAGNNAYILQNSHPAMQGAFFVLVTNSLKNIGKLNEFAKKTFALLSDKLKQAQGGLDRLIAGIITSARAEEKVKAQADILSEVAARRMEANMQKADQFTEETVLTDQLSPENVSFDGDATGNNSVPLAPNDGSGIINEGTQTQDGGGAGDAGGADGQYTVSAIETFTQGSMIPDEVLKNKPLYSPDANKWIDKGGKITVENGAWKYTDAQGISVTYISGYPDFKGSGHVKQEVDIGSFVDRSADYKRADQLAPNGPKSPQNSWHHNEDMKTMQEINRNIHITRGTVLCVDNQKEAGHCLRTMRIFSKIRILLVHFLC